MTAVPPARAARYGAGVAWSALNAAAGVLLPFLLFIFFARHLPPADVGVVMFAAAIAEIVKSFGLPGLYEALLQQPRQPRACHETAFAVLLSSGFVLLIVYTVVIGMLGKLMPDVARQGWILDLLGLRIVCDLATVQPQAALAQSLAFGGLAMRSIVANTGAGVIGVAIALYGQPLDGLVTYLAGQSVLVFLTTATGAGILVPPRFHRSAFAMMLKEASAASVVRLVAAINNYLDQIILAWSIGSQVLAYFNLAKRVEMTFITAASSFSGILFQPTFSIQALEARTDALRRALAVLGFICGVPCLFFVANSQDIVRIAFGPTWVSAAPVAAILAVSGFIRALGGVHGALLSVSGHNRRLMIVTSVSAASGIAAVVGGAQFGLVVVAVALALKNAAIVAWMADLTRGSLPDPIRTYLRGVAVPAGIMLAAATGTGVIARQMIPLDGLSADLLLLAISGLATTLAGILCFGPTIVPLYFRRVQPAAALPI